MSPSYSKLIHLLYVPTLFCNMGCRYCYLGKQTENTLDEDISRSVETLEFALEKFKKESILPFNVSLHGGEVTTLPEDKLDQLFHLIKNHYLLNYDTLNANGFSKYNPHIKTNLYNFHKLYDLMLKHKVSISGSVDIPLSLHDKYRIGKNGKSTIDLIKSNLKLLGGYPYNKKISTTLYNEHLEDIDKIIKDIWYINNELNFDMNNFNFMFGFESKLNEEKFSSSNRDITTSISDDKQVEFYNKMKKEFLGTELETGFRKNWFDEFKPSYCTNSVNCGERFFLLQSNGDIFSCVRGQGVEPFHYGNIFKDNINHILSQGQHKIQVIHQQEGFHEDCQDCNYLHLCNTGCPFVKHQKHNGKSYTCKLQLEIYKDNPETYPALKTSEEKVLARDSYKLHVHPHLSASQKDSEKVNTVILPNDLYEDKNVLSNIIQNDKILKELYTIDKIAFEQNGNITTLESQILKTNRTLLSILDSDTLFIHIHNSLFKANCNDIVRNTLHLQMLRDTSLVYGDEQRAKQEHLFTYQIFYNQLEKSKKMGDDFLAVNITDIIKAHKSLYRENTLNNLFVTTSYLRDYHYSKQKNNAFYHIQAINLPFQNIEFYWEGAC